MFNENSSLLRTGKCIVKRVVIDADYNEYQHWVYEPMIEYFFMDDPRKRIYGFTDDIHCGTIALAYEYLTSFIPVGTPFDFIAHGKKINKPLFSHPIIPGDSLSQLLTDEDHSFICSTSWTSAIPFSKDLRFKAGNFSINEWNICRESSVMVWPELIISILLTALILFLLFSNQVDWTFSLSAKLGLLLEGAILISLLILLDKSDPKSMIPKNPAFQFEVNASTIKTLSP